MSQIQLHVQGASLVKMSKNQEKFQILGKKLISTALFFLLNPQKCNEN